ncbi:MAG: hypothetical protein NVSMB4_17270 [Acidimicrobiales bacterium]
MSLAEKSAHPSALRAVQVRSSFDGGWHRGFVISDVVMNKSGVVGYHLRRTSDRTVLPDVFVATDVRHDTTLPGLGGEAAASVAVG